MAEFIHIHPENPQARLLKKVSECLTAGGIIAYPTDSAYALGCRLEDRVAIERIRKIRGIDQRHHLTLVCRDLSEIATYAQVDNRAFRFLKARTPGAYTFILTATKAVPRYFQCKSRKSIGLRVPDNRIVQDLLLCYNHAIASASLILPEQQEPMHDPATIADVLNHQIDLVIDGGYCGIEPTTVIDLCDGEPQVIRQGKGDVSDLIA
ncbi:MAG: L-threonylcarbamoyladenylate synthase [Pseudomonadota bacterium]